MFARASVLALMACAAATGSAHATALVLDQTNLITDPTSGLTAQATDPNLINPWGVSFGPGGPFWISENGTGVTSVDAVKGGVVTLNVIDPAVTVAAPPAQASPSSPTGQAFVGGLGFTVTSGGKSGAAVFAFATEDGTISAWAPSVNGGASTIIAVDNAMNGSGAVYKGLAVGNDGGKEVLYAANFRSGQVEMYDASFSKVGQFTDPTVPAGYAPFNVQVLGGKVYVTFALQDSQKHDDVAGLGHGFIDAFNLDGTGMQRVASMGTLDSPWGLAIAPSSFGKLAGDLMAGNFGNGEIGVFDPATGAFLGDMRDLQGQIIHIGDLWALTPGGGGNDGDPNLLYFTAGVTDEAHGLFGSLAPTFVASAPEPTAAALLLAGLAPLAMIRRRRNQPLN